jgi:hypothetical protein
MMAHGSHKANAVFPTHCAGHFGMTIIDFTSILIGKGSEENHSHVPTLLHDVIKIRFLLYLD